MQAWIIADNAEQNAKYGTVVAPPGYYYSTKQGKIVRDKGASLRGGPEWGSRDHAYRFRSHRAAARVASRCGNTAKVISV